MLFPPITPALAVPLTLRLPRQLCLRRGATIGQDRLASTPSGMANASHRTELPRLRLLCLHSFRTSAAIFQDQVLLIVQYDRVIMSCCRLITCITFSSCI